MRKVGAGGVEDRFGVAEDPASYHFTDHRLSNWGRIGIAMVSSDFRFVCLLEVTVPY